jgi:hypothetical protein
MEWITALFFLVCWSGLFFSLGYGAGTHAGTRDTEKRWSDAVTKAEWVRKYGQK